MPKKEKPKAMSLAMFLSTPVESDRPSIHVLPLRTLSKELANHGNDNGSFKFDDRHENHPSGKVDGDRSGKGGGRWNNGAGSMDDWLSKGCLDGGGDRDLRDWGSGFGDHRYRSGGGDHNHPRSWIREDRDDGRAKQDDNWRAGPRNYDDCYEDHNRFYNRDCRDDPDGFNWLGRDDDNRHCGRWNDKDAPNKRKPLMLKKRTVDPPKDVHTSNAPQNKMREGETLMVPADTIILQVDIFSLSGDVICTISAKATPGEEDLIPLVAEELHLPTECFKLVFCEPVWNIVFLSDFDGWNSLFQSACKLHDAKCAAQVYKALKLCRGCLEGWYSDFRPLHLAISLQASAIVEALLQVEADPNEKTFGEFAKPALHIAAKVGNADTLRVLVAAGAEVNTVDSDGDTPLLIAVCRSDCRFTEILLNAKADLSMTNHLGENAFDVAEMLQHQDVMQMLNDML